MSTYFRSKLVKGNGGFSLVEMMVVIGIIVFTLAIGVPAYNLTIRPTARLNGAARQVHGDIQLARLRAVSDNIRCGVAFAAGPAYTVFVDSNSNSQFDAGEQVIKSVALSNEYPNVQFDSSQGGGDGIDFDGIDSFAMRPQGLSTLGADGSVWLTNEKGEGRRIVVQFVGGARIDQY